MVYTLTKNENGSWYNWTGEELLICDYVTCQEADRANWKQFATEQEARAFWELPNETV